MTSGSGVPPIHGSVLAIQLFPRRGPLGLHLRRSPSDIVIPFIVGL